MKITSIEAIPFTIAYHHPIAASSGTLHSAEHVLVRIRTDEGLVGIGEAVARPFIYGESQASIVEAIRLWIAPALIGTDPFAVEEAHARIAWVVANNTARGAIDVALHDLRGKATGQPSWRLLGGSGAPLRITRTLVLGEAEQLRDEAVQAMGESGITSFKIKVGGDVRADIARVAAVRKAVGDKAHIYVDANHGWRAEHAIQALTGMMAYDVDLAEEPCPAEDRIGRQRIAQQVAIPIMADESVPTVADAARELVSGAARALCIKIARTGFTESARLVALANAHGARTVLGGQADSMIGAAAGVAFGSAFPSTVKEPAELDYHGTFADQLVAEPLIVRDGVMVPTQRPGIGVEIDEDKLSRYRIDQR